MSTQQDGGPEPDGLDATGSFWEIGNYKHTVERISDGHRLCNDLISLVTERSEIEKTYAKSLKSWSKKWHELVTKGPEYGTVQSAWLGVLTEADRLCELHLKVRQQLVDGIQAKIKQWQKESYHKSMMTFKEVKDAEDGFRKAQKPWAKRLEKVIKTMKDYHQACKAEKTAINQEKNSLTDSSVSDDQKKKLGEKVEKCQKDVELCKEKYEMALSEITKYNAEYIENMTEVFQKCQDSEQKRQVFFKDVMFEIRDTLNVAKEPEYAALYNDVRESIEAIDPQVDLRWWSQNRGTDMPMSWPAFEEYSPDLHAISRKSRKDKPADSGEGITITAIKKQPDAPVGNDYYIGTGTTRAPANAKANQVKESAAVAVSHFESKAPVDRQYSSLNPFEADDDNDGYCFVSSSSSSTSLHGRCTLGLLIRLWPSVTARPAVNVSGGAADEHSRPDSDFLVDDGRPGVLVRALYDYAGSEDDELTFRAGETFEKLAEEDEQGWCTGRKDGRVGLYPANYVEPMASS